MKRTKIAERKPVRLVALAALSIAACAAQAALPIQHWTTASGARVYFVESRGIPMLDVNVDFDAGGRRAPADKAGLGGLTHTLIKAGSASELRTDIGNAPADLLLRARGGSGFDQSIG